MAVDLLARLRVATLQMLLPAIDTELRVVGRRHNGSTKSGEAVG
jgi:hypothetical protein